MPRRPGGRIDTHGLSAYRAGCKCAQCRGAEARRRAAARARRTHRYADTTSDARLDELERYADTTSDARLDELERHVHARAGALGYQYRRAVTRDGSGVEVVLTGPAGAHTFGGLVACDALDAAATWLADEKSRLPRQKDVG